MTPIKNAREYSLYTAFSDRALQMRQREMARLQEQASTGLRVNRSSDDPASFSLARQMEVLGNRYNQYQRSIQSAHVWVDQSQQALDEIAELFMQAEEEGLRASNDTFSEDERTNVAGRLDTMLESLLDRLNARAGDEYLFAGARSTVKPFEMSAGAIIPTSNDGTGDRTRHIGPDQRLTINITGDRLFNTDEGFTIAESLKDLADAFRSGTRDDIDAALGRVQTARNHVIELGTEAGTISNRLDLAEGQLRDATLLAEQRRSELEDADIAETIMKFQREQTGLQAALKVTASVMQTSLLDYLR